MRRFHKPYMNKEFFNPIGVAILAGLVFSLSLLIRLSFQETLASEIPTPTLSAGVIHATTREEDLQLLRMRERFSALSLEAKAVAVWDEKNSRLLYGRNEERQLPLASLTKVMLAYSASQVLPGEMVVSITQSDLLEEGESGLSAGSRFTLSDLLSATMVGSVNDAATAISRTAGSLGRSAITQEYAKKRFVERMNDDARALGLGQTYFLNEDGLDVGLYLGGAYGSAKDMAVLFSAALEDQPVWIKSTTEEEYMLPGIDGGWYRYFNTNQYIRDYPGILGSKTGYTELAGGNLLIGFEHGERTIVIAILGSSKEGRFSDAKKLYDLSVELLPTSSQ